MYIIHSTCIQRESHIQNIIDMLCIRLDVVFVLAGDML